MSLSRLYVDGPLGRGLDIVLNRDQSRYLATVMRRRVGERLLLFNGRDGEWRAEISALERGREATARIEHQTREQTAAPDLWLLFAPVKRTPMEIIARCATELGVSALMPVLTRQSTTRRVKLERLRTIALEAAEQCDRLTLPDCEAPISLADRLADWPPERRLLFCDESGGGAPVRDALATGTAGPWAVIIGPEGGFTAEEIETLAAMKETVRVSFGRRILRVDTAVVAALSCWQALAGDWR